MTDSCAVGPAKEHKRLLVTRRGRGLHPIYAVWGTEGQEGSSPWSAADKSEGAGGDATLKSHEAWDPFKLGASE